MMRLLAAFLIASAAAPVLAADARSYLQYDAVIEGDSVVPFETGGIALFLRFYVMDDRYAAELVHYEPRWNLNNYGWYPIGLAFYSDGERFTAYNFFRDGELTVAKPADQRPPAQASNYSPTELAYTEAETLASMAAFRDALDGRQHDSESIHIDRRDGRVHSVTWKLPAESIVPLADDATAEEREAAKQDHTDYQYDEDGQLERMLVRMPQRLVPAGGTLTVGTPTGQEERQPNAVYLAGGRTATIDFAGIPLGETSARLPVRIETRHTETGTLLHTKRHFNFQRHTLAPEEEAPWEAWALAKPSAREDSLRQLVAAHLESGDDAAHRVALEEFVLPLAQLDANNDTPAERLRAFYHTAHAADMLGDEAFQRDGFAWYMDTLASLGSSKLVLSAGIDRIRQLIRLGHEDAAESAVRMWQATLHTFDGDDYDALMTDFAERGTPYFVFRAFEVPENSPWNASDRFQHHYWRCMALQRHGANPTRSNAAQTGRAPAWWADATSHEWLDLVELAYLKAEELFAAIEEPTIPERRTMHRLETFLTDAREGRVFAPAGA